MSDQRNDPMNGSVQSTRTTVQETSQGIQAAPMTYKKFTSQDDLGHFLVEHYKIRTPRDLTSCEVCHR